MSQLQHGRYRCEVLQQEVATAKSGKEMFVFQVKPICRLVQGPEGVEEDWIEDATSRTVRLVINPSNEKQMFYLMKKLRYAGFESDDFVDLALEGREVECTCDLQEYQGKPSEQWDFALPPLDSAPKGPLDPKAARKLNALFGKEALKAGAVKKTATEPVAKPEPAKSTVPPDDEVPF